MVTLEYGREQRSWRWLKWLLILAGSLMTALWLLFSNYEIDDRYICQECGAVVTERHWFGVSSWKTIAIRETPVTEALARCGIGVGHSHRWAFLNENGYSIAGGWYCGLGSASRVLNNTGHDAAGLLENVYTYRGPKEGGIWRHRLLDMTTADQ